MPEARLLIVAYHYVRARKDLPYPGIHPVTMEELRDQVELMRKHWQVISPEEAQQWAAGGKLSGDSVLITFDDGLVDHYHAAQEVLDPLGIRAAFFVPTLPFQEQRGLGVHLVHWLRAHTEPEQFQQDFVSALSEASRKLFESAAMRDKWQHAADETYQFDAPQHRLLKYFINFIMPWEELAATCERMLVRHGVSMPEFRQRTYLSDAQLRSLIHAGHTIGCHGHSHVPFSRLEGSVEQQEMTACVDTVRGWQGAHPEWVAYPYGGDWALPKNPADFCHRWGFCFGLTYRRGWNDRSVPPVQWKRIDVNEIPQYIG
jgi:peptidoglycan/xylan/chitin deacetylase (PgdA/CDA1 family)